MSKSAPPDYDLNVFINCPFDRQYLKLFNAVIFAVHDCGFIARCALEVSDTSQVRVSKILQIIAQCRVGIHDISRTEVDVDSQGTLLAVHVTAANKADGAEAAAVMVQAVERHPTIESFTADKSYQRQAEKAARELLGRDLHVTAKPASTTQKKALSRSPSAGALSGRSSGSASAGFSPKTMKRASPAPKRGSGAR